MSENQWVRRPLETLFGLAIAFIVLGFIFAGLRWALNNGTTPFDGQMMEMGLSVFSVVLWVVFGLAIAGLVIAAIFMVAGRLFVSPPWGAGHDWGTTAGSVEIKSRYAKGLVSREEYLRVLSDLQAASAAAPPAATPK